MLHTNASNKYKYSMTRAPPKLHLNINKNLTNNASLNDQGKLLQQLCIHNMNTKLLEKFTLIIERVIVMPRIESWTEYKGLNLNK